MKIFDHKSFPILYALVMFFQLPNKSETVALIFYRLDKTVKIKDKVFDNENNITP